MLGAWLAQQVCSSKRELLGAWSLEIMLACSKGAVRISSLVCCQSFNQIFNGFHNLSWQLAADLVSEHQNCRAAWSSPAGQSECQLSSWEVLTLTRQARSLLRKCKGPRLSPKSAVRRVRVQITEGSSPTAKDTVIRTNFSRTGTIRAQARESSPKGHCFGARLTSAGGAPSGSYHRSRGSARDPVLLTAISRQLGDFVDVLGRGDDSISFTAVSPSSCFPASGLYLESREAQSPAASSGMHHQ